MSPRSPGQIAPAARTKRIAVIIDDGQIDRWQAEALNEVKGLAEVALVLDCTNTRRKRSYFKHFGYYVLNAFAIRNRFSRGRAYTPDCLSIQFETQYQGAWQTLPEEVLAALDSHGVDYIVKFGMGLLRIEGRLSRYPVLSYHHGDPEHYRGRPAGFYEIAHDEDVVGLIVQQLSNTLDGGVVLARDYAKISRHSYKQTVEQLYQASRYTLRAAFLALDAGEHIRIASLGKNHRLPSNVAVAVFLIKLLGAKLARIYYGLFTQKQWEIAEATIADCSADTLNDALNETTEPRCYSPPPRYSFLADPFYHPDGKSILAEALSGSTGLGEIVTIDRFTGSATPVLKLQGHLSYPFTLHDSGRDMFLPEMASHTAPSFFSAEKPFAPAIPINGLTSERLLDATCLAHGGNYYIFACRKGAPDCLHLFVSDAISGPYLIHPQSPILNDPRGARMAGRIMMLGDQLIRFGQDNSRSYGQAAIGFAIDTLTPTEFNETRVQRVAFKDRNGPHTLDRDGDSFLFDFYHERFSLLAGYGRVRARLSARLQR